MNRSAYKVRSATPEWMDSASGALVWVLFAAAGLLLMWFIAVLNDITERGEQRRIQQRTTGSLILADEKRAQPERGAAVLTASTEVPLR